MNDYILLFPAYAGVILSSGMLLSQWLSFPRVNGGEFIKTIERENTMSEKKVIDPMWDDKPVDVSAEVSFIWSIANKLRGPYRSDKYKDVIVPMVIIRRFECALADTKDAVVKKYKEDPNYPPKAMQRIAGYQFYNVSEFTLAELVNDSDHLAENFKSYLQGFSPNVSEILLSEEKGLDFDKQIDKMDKNNRLLSVVKAFSELDLDPKTIYLLPSKQELQIFLTASVPKLILLRLILKNRLRLWNSISRV